MLTEYQKTWDDAKWRDWQRMKDDAMVNDYMAVIDTRIDRVVLDWRMRDTILDGIMGSLNRIQNAGDWGVKIRVNRIIAEHMEHEHRPDDLQEMIQNIRSSNFHIPSERESAIGFGPYDGNDDKYLSMVLDYAGPDYADEEEGDTAWSEYVMRFDRCLLATDDQGFRTLVICDTEEIAKDEFKRFQDAYHKWLDTQEDED